MMQGYVPDRNGKGLEPRKQIIDAAIQQSKAHLKQGEV